MMSQFSQEKLPEWELELIHKYPLIYLEQDEYNVQHYWKSGDRTFDADDYCNLRNGFEFRKGWKELGDEFSATASELVTHLRATMQLDAYIHACIFKEKFGELRWQGRSNLLPPFSELFWSYERSIEKRSTRICEITGTPGELREINYWYQTLCKTEYIKACNKQGVKPKLRK